MNEYQKKRVEGKLKLNYYTELKKENNSISSFRILFSNELDILFLDHTDPDLWYKVHEHMELWLEEIGYNTELVEFAYFSIEMPKVLTVV